MAYVITEVDCDTGQPVGDPMTARHDLEDLLLPIKPSDDADAG